jgi:hypothetical protein
MCPVVGGIGRIGIHHQPTQLVVTFDGTVDPTKAENRGNYSVLTPAGKTIPVTSATFNPATNSVTLIPGRRLNVHHHFRLSLVLPCVDGQTMTAVIPFGSKQSLIGFYNRRGEFVSVKDGRIVGFYNNQDQFVPVHTRKVEQIIKSES